MNVIDRLHELFEFFWMQICFLVFWFSASRSYQELSRSAYVIRWGTTTPQHRPLHLSLFLWDSVAKMNEFSASIVDDDSHSALHKRGRNQIPPILLRPYRCSQSRKHWILRSREYVVVSCFAWFIVTEYRSYFGSPGALPKANLTILLQFFISLIFNIAPRKQTFNFY